MFNFFKKPPVVEFLCVMPGALEIHPIESAKAFRPEWFKKSTQEWAENFKKGSPHRSIGRCPGITKLYNTGWIVSAWQDIEIEIFEDGRYIWATNFDETPLRYDKCLPVDDQSVESFKHSEFLSRTMSILKINAPWHVKIPKGYNMLQLPIPYQEHDLYTAAQGIYERSFGNYELNILLLCNKIGKFTIKAGTPLAHLILIKDEKPKHIIRYATTEECEQCSKKVALINSMKPVIYSKLKKALMKVYKEKEKCPFGFNK